MCSSCHSCTLSCKVSLLNLSWVGSDKHTRTHILRIPVAEVIQSMCEFTCGFKILLMCADRSIIQSMFEFTCRFEIWQVINVAISTDVLQASLQINPVDSYHSELMAARASVHYVTILAAKILDTIIDWFLIVCCFMALYPLWLNATSEHCLSTTRFTLVDVSLAK